MNSLLFYFVKSGIAMALFYGVYRIFLEKETNWTLNRFFLIGSLLLSLVLPLLPLPQLFDVRENMNLPVYFINLEEDLATNSFVTAETGSAVGGILKGWTIVTGIYLAGIIILLSILFIQIGKLVLMKKLEIRSQGPLKIIFVHQGIAPFSLFNRVYISRKNKHDGGLQTIIDHEYEHYRHLHFIDLVLLEFITIFQWFNPFTWLYVKSLKEVHEYQADAALLRHTCDVGTYRALLVNQLTGTEVFRLSNSFSKSLTKKRMIMMTQMKSKKHAWMKVLIAVPVLAGLLLAFSGKSSSMTQQEKETITGRVIHSETGDPLPGTTVIWKGHTLGTQTDRNGEFSLDVPEKNASLVYSYVGFWTLETRGSGPHDIKMAPSLIPVRLPEDVDPVTEVKETQGKNEEDAHPDADGYTIVEDPAHFPGGVTALKKYLEENIHYPEETFKGETRIGMKFIIESNGSVTDVEVLSKYNEEMDGEATRLISEMPDWKPAIQAGKIIRSGYYVPVKFDRIFGDLQDKSKVEKYFIVEEMPEFEGEFEKSQDNFRYWIMNNMKYPEDALKKGISGKVYLQFAVNMQGKVEDVKVVRSVHPLLDKEALRVVESSPDWTPGYQNEVPVNVVFTFPVEFSQEMLESQREYEDQLKRIYEER